MPRPTQDSLAKARWRRVWTNDHSPPTDSCSCSGSAAARPGRRWPTSGARSCPRPPRNPSAVVGRNLGRSGVAPVELGFDQWRHVDPVDHQVLDLAARCVVSSISTPRIVTPVRSESRMREPLSKTISKREPCMSARSNVRPREVLESFGHGFRLGGLEDARRPVDSRHSQSARTSSCPRAGLRQLRHRSSGAGRSRGRDRSARIRPCGRS